MYNHKKSSKRKLLINKPQKVEVIKKKENVGIPSHIVKSSNKKKALSQQKKTENTEKQIKYEASDSDSGSSINSTKNKSNLEGLK